MHGLTWLQSADRGPALTDNECISLHTLCMGRGSHSLMAVCGSFARVFMLACWYTFDWACPIMCPDSGYLLKFGYTLMHGAHRINHCNFSSFILLIINTLWNGGLIILSEKCWLLWDKIYETVGINRHFNNLSNIVIQVYIHFPSMPII